MATNSRYSGETALARLHVPEGLGMLSLGIGLAALFAPRSVGKLTGLRKHPGLLQLIGVREVTSGIGLLSGRQTEAWLWSRVAGDVVDLAVLAASNSSSRRSRTVGTAAVVAAITAADIVAAVQHSRARRTAAPSEVYVDHTIIVNKSPQECYAFWRQLDNIPRFSRRLRAVTSRENGESHWSMTLPGGGSLEWNSVLTVQRPGERLSWRSLTHEPFSHAGSVQFATAPGARGTFVTVSMHYRLPPAVSWSLVGFLGRDPFGELREDLRRFKQLIETGEVATTEGQPSGQRSWFGRLFPEGRRSRQPETAAARSADRQQPSREEARV